MLDYKILNKKPFITDKKTNEKYYDLLSQTFKGELDKTNLDYNLIVVNKYYIARPDLISLAVYGDDKYADAICKINDISNPFELNEDDVLIIPDIDIIESLFEKKPQTSQFITKSNNSVASTKNINDNRKKVSEKRSANDMTVGNSNYIIDKSLGLVFY